MKKDISAIALKEPVIAVVHTFVESLGMVPKAHELIPTRESLLSRLRDMDDWDSWQEFLDIYWKLIYNSARQAGLADAEAQDVVQETLISVARNIEGFRYDPRICSFKRWMLQLTRWRIINRLKKRQRDSLAHPSASSEETGSTVAMERIPDPAGCALEQTWDEEWEKNLIAAATERVKRRVDAQQWQVFDLYCIEQWPAQKVARMLEINIGSVYLAKHRIGRLLRNEVHAIQQLPLSSTKRKTL